MEDSLLGDHACYSLVRVPDDGAHTLGSLAESKGITCSRGQGFYQLGKKKESVSEKKEMVLVERQDEDDEDAAAVVDAIDDAAKVRKELGIGAAKANINESVSEDFMVFVQSTSANRKLVPGAYALYRRDDIDVGKKRKLVLSGAESSAPKRAKKSAEPEVAHLPAEVWGAVAGKLDASYTPLDAHPRSYAQKKKRKGKKKLIGCFFCGGTLSCAKLLEIELTPHQLHPLARSHLESSERCWRRFIHSIRPHLDRQAEAIAPCARDHRRGLL
eukprot:TRINITY_DN104_c0_g1_i1.p1 TRINITY_DN104_c0_g1~~TRINITY_DN104_c0_g1_i1.p1  ORF type:complete len:272 (-),score=72.13 TRINITY_DN104_c0_g1_i1:897-1712(-)